MTEDQGMPDPDELRRAWAAYDRTLDATVGVNRQLLVAAHLMKVQTPLQRLFWLMVAEAVVQVVAVLMLGSFIYDNVLTLQFALPGVVLEVLAIGLLVLLVRCIVMARRIDFLVPVATIQAQLAALRVQTTRITQYVLLAAPLVWALFVIVAFRGFWGLDTYELLGYEYLLAQVAFGLAFIPLAIWLSRRVADRLRHTPTLRRILRDIGGYNLRAAEDALAALDEFASEPRAQ